jgi:phage terminase small subunit
MAGKSRAEGGKTGGHNRKAVEQHLEAGTFRADRHGDANALVPGRPLPTMELGEQGKRVWGEVLEQLPEKSLGKVDSTKLTLLCVLTDRLHQWLERWALNPDDANARIAVSQLTQHVDKLGGQFGLSPKDRTRLAKVVFVEQDETLDPFLQFLRDGEAIDHTQRN